jgi:hypothetical protein
MILKRISNTSIQNPTYEKKNTFPVILLVVQIWKKYAPKERIANFKNDSELPRNVILAGHFYWFCRFVLSTGILTSTALMVQ